MLVLYVCFNAGDGEERRADPVAQAFMCCVCVCVSCVFYLVHRTNARCVAFSKVLIQQCHTRVTHLRYVCSTLQ